MNAYEKLRKQYRPHRLPRPIILTIEIIVGGWVGIGLGFLILRFIK